ncbi:MAG: hypothetical protein K2N09_08990 [Muribaculaceae bacterium]|nr:hypothetical protein [Muribaculaceae bacterium]
MNTNLECKTNLDFQVDVAKREEGRFIPYIGKNYDKGLGSKDKDVIGRFGRDSNKNESNVKILVIGTRHYCDARNSSRNLLAFLTKKVREDIICGKSIYFPDNLKVGCIRDSAETCLKDKSNNCPVFRNEETKRCLLSKECFICRNVSCNQERNLRCETLIAIKDYLDNRVDIETQNVGRIFFDNITNLIVKEFKPSCNGLIDIWSCIAFSNLIQKYISTSFIKDAEINKKVREDDRKFIREVIEQLKPHIIIATNKCVKTHLKTVVKDLHYGEWKDRPGDFHICEKNDVVITDKWKNILKECIEKCPFWKKSSEYKGFLNGVLDELKDKKNNHEIMMPTMKHIHAYVLSLLIEKIKEGLKEGEMVDKYMLKIYDPNKSEPCPEKKVSTIGEWLRKYDPESIVQLNAYNKGKKIFEEIFDPERFL